MTRLTKWASSFSVLFFSLRLRFSLGVLAIRLALSFFHFDTHTHTHTETHAQKHTQERGSDKHVLASPQSCLNICINQSINQSRNKEQGSCTGILSRGNHRQSKPKEGKVKVRDLRGILVRSSRAQSQAVGRSIYIIGNAEAFPILCVRYIR